MSEPILVKLKMKKIYKTFLSFIGTLIILVGFVGIAYLFYDKVLESDSDIEVNGALSINYVNGKKFNIKPGETKKIEFSVSNASEIVNYYNIGFMQVRGYGTYKILYDDIVVMEGKLKSTTEINTDYVSIDSNETKIYTLELYNRGNDDLKGALNIRNQNGHINTFADTILSNNKIVDKILTKVGYEEAVEDEGLIKSSDDIGVSYYFRGDVQSNYVSFGGLSWRIVRINGDGTVRIILDGVTDTIASYYTSENNNFEFNKSNMNVFLENWLDENLGDYTNYIANTKYCSDISIDNSNTFMTYTRVMTNKIPTLNCLGTSTNNSIGLITIDEVILAGATPSGNNTSFYLYKPEINNDWYTMSGAKGSDKSINMFMVGISGNIKNDVTGDLYRNVRPVINLIKNIEMIGDGTKNNPYRLYDK